MGILDYVSDLYSSLAPQAAEAEVSGGASTKTPASGTDEESSSEAAVNKEDASGSDESDAKGQVAGEGAEPSGAVTDEAAEESGDDEEEGGDEEEEEEEEEEPEDPKPKIEAECMESKECAPAKHHYDHCVERVTGQQEEHGKAHEDCVEEFFHLAHCATQCAAPKLFNVLR